MPKKYSNTQPEKAEPTWINSHQQWGPVRFGKRGLGCSRLTGSYRKKVLFNGCWSGQQSFSFYILQQQDDLDDLVSLSNTSLFPDPKLSQHVKSESKAWNHSCWWLKRSCVGAQMPAKNPPNAATTRIQFPCKSELGWHFHLQTVCRMHPAHWFSSVPAGMSHNESFLTISSHLRICHNPLTSSSSSSSSSSSQSSSSNIHNIP